MLQYINYDLIHNSPYQRRKALDKNTNYSINHFEIYKLYSYSVGTCFLIKFVIQMEFIIIWLKK